MIKKLSRFKNLEEQDKIVYKNVIIAFIVKGFALFVTLFTMPSYISFFNNNEVLGFWFTILSLVNWILNFDLGIGNGLRNHLSYSLSLKDDDSAKRYISSAYFSIGVIVVILGILLVSLLIFLNLNSIFKISTDVISNKTLLISLIIVIVGILGQFWLKLINSILYALQKSSINNFLVLCTNISILIAINVIPSGSNNRNIIVMSIVHTIAVLLPLLIASICVFSTKLRHAIPKLKYVSKEYIKKVLTLGGIFFFVQVAYMIIMSTNEYLLTLTTGNSFVVEYQAYYKIFSISSTVFALALTPVWSIITKAKAEKNKSWVIKTYKKFMLLAGLFCLFELILVIIMRPLMSIWLGKNLNFELSTITGIIFAIYGCLMVTNTTLSTFANGLSELKVQAICFGIGAIAKVPLSIFLTNVIHHWTGVIIANVICMGIYTIVEPFFVKKYISKI